MRSKKRILLKITGELFCQEQINRLHTVVSHIVQLHAAYQFGIVVGGGNIFRGTQDTNSYAITQTTGHHAGMLATVINSLILQDLLHKTHIPTSLFSSVTAPTIGYPLDIQRIWQACNNEQVIIFAGGTGAPYVTTDTNAVICALHIGAHTIWKGSTIDGIYTADPKHDPHATRLASISYTEACNQNLGVIDPTALRMAAAHNLHIRIFSLFTQRALLQAVEDNTFGSHITQK